MANYLVTDTELTSVADAIRTKGGTSADLEFPSGFVTAIGNISGGGSTLGTKTITANDTYDAQDDGYDGYSQVTVNVPASAVDTGTKNISTNGTHDVIGFASASVSVPTGTARSSADLTASNLTVTAPAGLYAEAASKTLTDQNLVAGNIKKDVTIFGTTGTYEGGGGLTKVTGSFTVASNSLTMYVTGLGGTPKVVKFYIRDNAFDSVSKILGGIYAYGPGVIQQTNNAGTGNGNVYAKIGDYMSDPSIPADNTDPGTDRIIATTTGFAVHAHASSWQFKAGYTYDYVVLY